LVSPPGRTRWSGRPTPRPTANRGLSFVDPDQLKKYVTLLDADGFQVHVHAIGERAVREALDAFEAVRSNDSGVDNRHHIAHIQVVHPDDVGRFAALAVTANAQPLWALNEPQMTELTIPFLGDERAGWQYPFGDLHRSGARLAFGSDWSVSSPNPLWGVHVAVNRTAPAGYVYGGGDGPSFLPHQRLDLDVAVRAATAGSAYVNHLDDETGSLEPGKAADVVVLDRDLYATDSGEIGDTSVLLTMVEGAVVFEAAGL
jgi:predicted amidohydrolase YtcJ